MSKLLFLVAVFGCLYAVGYGVAVYFGSVPLGFAAAAACWLLMPQIRI